MKKAILLLLLLSYGMAHSQPVWKDYQYDENITVKLPDVNIIDTTIKNLRVVMAITSNGLFTISTAPNETPLPNVQRKEDLLKPYSGFQKGMQEGAHATISNENIVERNGLTMKQFTMTTRANGTIFYIHTLILFAKAKWYTFSYTENGFDVLAIDNERETFFSSVNTISNKGFNDQINGVDKYYLLGSLLAKVCIGLAVLVGIILYIRNQNRSKKSYLQTLEKYK